MHWKSDILTEFDPYETGLARFVGDAKPDFVGKAALADRRTQGPCRRLVTLQIDDDIAAAHSNASVMYDGAVVGAATSAAYGHRVKKYLALALLDANHVAPGRRLRLDTLGHLRSCTIIPACPFDASGQRLRS